MEGDQERKQACSHGGLGAGMPAPGGEGPAGAGVGGSKGKAGSG